MSDISDIGARAVTAFFWIPAFAGMNG